MPLPGRDGTPAAHGDYSRAEAGGCMVLRSCPLTATARAR